MIVHAIFATADFSRLSQVSRTGLWCCGPVRCFPIPSHEALAPVNLSEFHEVQFLFPVGQAVSRVSRCYESREVWTAYSGMRTVA